MNCPAKMEPIIPDGHNQNPDALSSDLTTRSDLGKVANARLQREHRLSNSQQVSDAEIIPGPNTTKEAEKSTPSSNPNSFSTEVSEKVPSSSDQIVEMPSDQGKQRRDSLWRRCSRNVLKVLKTYCKFVGPGFMVSVVSILFYSKGS